MVAVPAAVVVVAAAIALAAVAVQAAAAVVVAVLVAVAATAAEPRYPLAPKNAQRSKRNKAVLLREQQGVNWSLASCSSPVKYMSR